MISAEVNISIILVSIKNSYLMTEKGPIASWVGMMISPEQKILLVSTKGT